MDFMTFEQEVTIEFFSNALSIKKHNSEHIKLLGFPYLEADLNINLRFHYSKKKVKKVLNFFRIFIFDFWDDAWRTHFGD